MNKIDQYILKKFISTYVLIQLLFIPIAIVVNLADNIDKLPISDATASATGLQGPYSDGVRQRLANSKFQ